MALACVFLWIPPHSKQVRTVVVGQNNMVEQGILEHPAFRNALADGQSGGSEGLVANSTIYDGNPAYVTANSMDLTSAGLGSSLSSLTVTVSISGGMNNGLYVRFRVQFGEPDDVR